LQNGRVSLRELFDQRFTALEKRLDDQEIARAAALKAVCEGFQTDIRDHEGRLRSLEKQSNWHWVAQVFGAILAAVGIRTGVTLPPTT
jgi:hypothetical protein